MMNISMWKNPEWCTCQDNLRFELNIESLSLPPGRGGGGFGGSAALKKIPYKGYKPHTYLT